MEPKLQTFIIIVKVDTNTLTECPLLYKKKGGRGRRLKMLIWQGTDALPETMHLMLTRLLSLHHGLDPQLLFR